LQSQIKLYAASIKEDEISCLHPTSQCHHFWHDWWSCLRNHNCKLLETE